MQINLSETIAWLHRQRADLSNNSWSIKSSLKTFTLLCPHVTKFAQSPSSLHLEKPAQTSTSYKCPFRLPSCKILLKSTMVAFCLIAVTSNVFGVFFFLSVCFVMSIWYRDLESFKSYSLKTQAIFSLIHFISIFVFQDFREQNEMVPWQPTNMEISQRGFPDYLT